MMQQHFEDILQEAGGFGRYQKILICVFLLPALIFVPWFSLGAVFLSSTPEHWCRIPELGNSSGLSEKDRRFMFRPESSPSCSMYDVNFTDILSQGKLNLSEVETWSTKPCSDGWEYDHTNYRDTASTRWNLVCENSYYSSMIISMVFFGNSFGAPVMGFLPDKIGRKLTFMFLVSVIGLTELLSTFMPSFTVYLIMRAINGSCGSLIYITTYVLLLELVSTDLRTRMNGLTTGAWTVGLCLLPLVAWLTRSWIGLSISISTAAFSLLLTWRIVPESPRWLVSQGRYEEAYSIICDISRANGGKVHESKDVLDQLRKIGEQMERDKEQAEKVSNLDFVRYPQLRKKFLIIVFCWACNSLAYYGLQVNVVKNMYGNEFMNFFLVSIVEFPSHGIAWYVMQRIGRRYCTVGAAAITCLSCLVPGLVATENGAIGIAASVFGKLGSSAAYMSLYQQAPELYPTSLRGFGMSLTASIGIGFSLAGPYITDLAVYGRHIPFLIFGILGLMESIAACFIPETLNQELPQTVSESEKVEIGCFLDCSRKKKMFSTGFKWFNRSSSTVGYGKARGISFIEMPDELGFDNPNYNPETEVKTEKVENEQPVSMGGNELVPPPIQGS